MVTQAVVEVLCLLIGENIAFTELVELLRLSCDI